MSPYFPPKSHQAHPIPPQHNHPASLTFAVTGDSMSPSRNLPLCLYCRSAIAGFLWRTASLLLKRRLRLAYRPETCDSGVASLAVIGSLWQRVARSIRVSLRSLSSELHLSQETACRRPETGRSAFTAARQSRGFSCGLRLFYSSFDFVSLTVPRPTIPASLLSPSSGLSGNV